MVAQDVWLHSNTRYSAAMPQINDLLYERSFLGKNRKEIAQEMLGFIERLDVLGPTRGERVRTLLWSLGVMQNRQLIEVTVDETGKTQISRGPNSPKPSWLS